MTDESHFRHLERMYHAAPSNKLTPATMVIGDGTATLTMRIEPSYRQAVGGVHGMLIFKLLDETGFYAANSRVIDVFLTTASMNTHFTSPPHGEVVTATARVLHQGRSTVLVEASVFDSDNTLVAHATGTFVRTRVAIPPR
ncbi:MAG: PaaI family thioesterase [Thermoleophilia bacterium]|nr:PaaI family thioesterase [Thermoleophilia bacterium]